jgi:multicomponent K+:H+ antiporter subunit E
MKLLPHPLWSVSLGVFWLWLNNTFDAGQVVLAALLGIALPLLTSRFWPERGDVRRPWLLLPFAAVVLADILKANIRVARAVLGPVSGLRPGFVRVPLQLRSSMGKTVLANAVSLTPGTLSVDVSADGQELVVHYLDEYDPGTLVADIQARYERPLMEVFG